jgi:hypothetical protein
MNIKSIKKSIIIKNSPMASAPPHKLILIPQIEQERTYQFAINTEQNRSREVAEKLEGTIAEQRKFIEIMVSQKQDEVGRIMKVLCCRDIIGFPEAGGGGEIQQRGQNKYNSTSY